jgi:hypothetical protein
MLTESTEKTINALVRQLFRLASCETPPDDLKEYIRVFETFGPDWQSPAEVGIEFHWAESAHAAGLLERLQTPIITDGRVTALRIRFRRNAELH